MATRYLGSEFDIHGGGLDLRFPHHENERAQSRAAGDGFARYWLHNAWVVASGEKMSKSVGNTLSMAVLLEQVRPVVLRYLLASAHYRSNIEIGDESARAERLAEAGAAYERIEGFVLRTAEAAGSARHATATWEPCVTAARVRGGHGRRPGCLRRARGGPRHGPCGQHGAGRGP